MFHVKHLCRPFANCSAPHGVADPGMDNDGVRISVEMRMPSVILAVGDPDGERVSLGGVLFQERADPIDGLLTFGQKRCEQLPDVDHVGPDL